MDKKKQKGKINFSAKKQKKEEIYNVVYLATGGMVIKSSPLKFSGGGVLPSGKRVIFSLSRVLLLSSWYSNNK